MGKGSRLALGVVTLIALLGSRGSAAPLTRWASRDVRLNAHPRADVGRYETAIAIDPLNPNIVVAGVIDLNWQQSHPNDYSNIRIYRSADGGGTWRDRGYSAFGDSGDPQFRFDGRGNLFAASVGARGIMVMQSTNGGLSWHKPVVVQPDTSEPASLDSECGLPDKEELAVDQGTGDVYVFWSLAQLECFVPSTEGDTTLVYFSRSIDHGASWSKPARVSEPGSTFALGAAPAIGPDETIYVAYWDQRPITSPADCPSSYAVVVTALQHNSRPALTQDIVIARSVDRGRHWAYSRRNICETTTMQLLKRYTDNDTYVTSALAAIAVDPASGIPIVVWTEAFRDGSYVVRMTRSRDRGRTWSLPTTVLGDLDYDYSFPSLTAQRGIFWLQYRRSNGDGMFDWFARESRDGGKTFTGPFRLSTVSSTGSFGGNTDIGDYQWVDSASGRVAGIWTDHRGSGANDVYVRVGTFAR